MGPQVLWARLCNHRPTGIMGPHVPQVLRACLCYPHTESDPTGTTSVGSESVATESDGKGSVGGATGPVPFSLINDGL
jgi:hypothetical protein